MTAVVEGVHTVDTPVLEHRENCLHGKADRKRPPEMYEERRVEHSGRVELIGLLDALDRRLEVPMVRTIRSRRNAAGEHIGPECLIRSCDALLYWRVQGHVVATLERGAGRRR